MQSGERMISLAEYRSFSRSNTVNAKEPSTVSAVSLRAEQPGVPFV